MKCFNCGCELSEKDFCTGCGADVGLYKKIMHISNRYYNDGLEKANVRDLSGAIVSLRQSLKFNKNHIEARNLLGLVYFEMGEVVAALSEWVISKNLRAKKNLADDYIDAIQSNPTRLDTINQTVKKYNLALRYCQQDSKDLAIIQLKKVLSLNPRLVQGHQLLALLYMDAEEWEKARKELVKCSKIDANNTTTLTYLKEVNRMLGIGEEAAGSSVKKKKAVAEETITYQSGNETIIQPLNVKEPRGTASILNIVIGVLIGVAASYFLILPARMQVVRNQMKDELKVVSENADVKSARISELEQTVSDLQQEKKELQDAVDGYTGVNGESHKVESLLQTATDYLSDPQDYEAIADTLYNVDTDYVQNSATDAYKQLYNKLMELVGSQVAEQMYRDGSAAINQSDYTTAISTLQKAWYFTRNMETPDPEVLYELAQAYQMAGETDKAKEAYNQIMQEYAQSQTAGKASERLTELGDSGDSQNVADTNTTTDQQAADTQTADTQTAEQQSADGQAEQQTQ